jgi:hypothetical protein
MNIFNRAMIDTHYGPFCWEKLVPTALPKGTLYYAQIIPATNAPGYAFSSLECCN